MTTQDAETDFPSELRHQHGLDDWWPMLPERSAETIDPEGETSERLYRCQAIGCGQVVRVERSALGASTQGGA
jgi:hypothetical protein